MSLSMMYKGMARASIEYGLIHFGIFRWLSQNVNEEIIGKIVEWLATDHHYYYKQLCKIFDKEFFDTQFGFYSFALLVSAVIIINRLYLPITVCIISIWLIKTNKYFIVKYIKDQTR
eukprot:126179_1